MAEAIRINCPGCSKSLKMPEKAVGRMVECSGCGAEFRSEAGVPTRPQAQVPVPPKPAVNGPSAAELALEALGSPIKPDVRDRSGASTQGSRKLNSTRPVQQWRPSVTRRGEQRSSDRIEMLDEVEVLDDIEILDDVESLDEVEVLDDIEVLDDVEILDAPRRKNRGVGRKHSPRVLDDVEVLDFDDDPLDLPDGYEDGPKVQAPRKPKRKTSRYRTDYREKRRSNSEGRDGGTDATVIGGLAMMIGAVVWFVVGYQAGWIYPYPIYLFFVGLISFVKGILD